MTAHELAQRRLSGPNIEVAILDGFNGGGDPRSVNMGPAVRDVNKAHQSMNTEDIDTESGDIVVLGFGCY